MGVWLNGVDRGEKVGESRGWDSKGARLWIGSWKGMFEPELNLLSGWLLRARSLIEEVRSERGGDLSVIRIGSSFFFMLSPCRSAADWN